MSLQFVGPRGSFEVRWVTYALLRDGVRSELERNGPDPLFAPIHAISGALGKHGVGFPARGLRLATLAARVGLYDLPSVMVAVSGETISVITGARPTHGESTLSPTELGGRAGTMAVEGAATFGDLISPIVEPLLSITEGALEQDIVEVSDL